jgi:hypothetical protein
MMKKLVPLLLIISVLFAGCKGDDGAPGADGVNVVGTTIEISNVNFNTGNEFSLTRKFTDVTNVKVLESDAVFVYILWDVTTTNAPMWRLVPQSILASRGVRYNFDYTPLDFRIFIENEDETFNLTSLDNSWTQNQTLRIVVIPSDFTARKSADIDYSDYNAVKNHFNLDDSKIIKYTVK